MAFRGLMVVMMAPMDKIAMQIMGKWIQFGERRIFKPTESDFTLCHSWRNVVVSPVAESMRAIRPLWRRIPKWRDPGIHLGENLLVFTCCSTSGWSYNICCRDQSRDTLLCGILDSIYEERRK